MRLLVGALVVSVLVVPAASRAAASFPAPGEVPRRLETLKKYKATITRKDKSSNTRTFTDYCEATSLSEAQKVFGGRYPDAHVSGVTETK